VAGRPTDGGDGRLTTTTTASPTSTSRPTARHPLPTRGNGNSPTSPNGGRGAGMDHERRLLRLRRRRPSRPVSSAAMSATGLEPHSQRHPARQALLLRPAHSTPVPSSSSGTRGRPLRDVSGSEPHRQRAREGARVVATDVNGDGLTDLFVDQQTVANHLWSTGAAAGGGRGLLAAVAFSARVDRARAWASTPRLRRDGWAGRGRRQHRHELFSLYRNKRERVVRRRGRRPGHRRRHAGDQLLGAQALRLRQRRVDGLLLANGHPDDMLDGSAYGVRYRQPPLLFRNEGGRYGTSAPRPARCPQGAERPGPGVGISTTTDGSTCCWRTKAWPDPAAQRVGDGQPLAGPEARGKRATGMRWGRSSRGRREAHGTSGERRGEAATSLPTTAPRSRAGRTARLDWVE